mgnify:CR=1 FL=1
MIRFVHKLVMLAMVLAIAMPLTAAERGKKGKKGRGAGIVAQTVARLKKNVTDLTTEQIEKIDALAKKYSQEIAEARKTVGEEALKEIMATRAKATEAGKKGKEVEQAVSEAVGKLSDAQQKAWAKARELERAFPKELLNILTPEQREKAQLMVKGGKKKA